MGEPSRTRAVHNPESPLALYGAALRRAVAGRPAEVAMHDLTGSVLSRQDARTWTEPSRDGDHTVVRRCAGVTIDLGCGPGRLCAALHAAGVPVLGIDISADAVCLARHRGAAVLQTGAFARLPNEGQWQRVLLVDGNIGIGGDPARLLRRCRRLLTPTGAILVEVDAPGSHTWAAQVTLGFDGRSSVPFRWATVSLGALEAFAARAGIHVVETWSHSGRWFALAQHTSHDEHDQEYHRRTVSRAASANASATTTCSQHVPASAPSVFAVS